MTPTVPESVLVYDRIAQNRRKTVMLMILAIASIIPFVAAASYGAGNLVVAYLGSHDHMTAEQEQRLKELLAPGRAQVRTELTETIEREIEKLGRGREEEEAQNRRLHLRATLIFALALTGVLGLLFWGLMSSPTAQVLAMCGARPSGPQEAEAKRMLENLAIGAGLPPPKLYVIDTPTPNAFAAGMDPKHAVVAVTTGLVKLLDRQELEGVLAHELSHIGNRDTRLNTVVTAIALFLRLPSLMRQRRKRQKRAGYHWAPAQRNYRFRYTLALLPLYVYVFFIAPLLAALIRAAISRSREFLADADGALLTRYPEGLMRALAKIGGAGSAMPASNPAISHLYFSNPSATRGVSLFRGSLLATHPPIEQRIQHLMEFNAGVPMSVIEEAVRAGHAYDQAHPPVESVGLTQAVTADELSGLTTGNVMGKACRALAATPVYDEPDPQSGKVANIAAGDLLVAFDDPGPMRQILTQNQTFGYIPRSVKLERVEMLPADVFDPQSRAAAEAAHAAERAAAAANGDARPGLTGAQIGIAVGLGVVVFAGLLLVMMTLGK